MSAALRVAYERAPLADLLAQPDMLAVIGFGAAAPASHGDPRYLRVDLEPLDGDAPFETWRGAGDVAAGRTGAFAHAEDGRLQFAAVEVEEGGDVAAATEAAYAALVDFLAVSGYPHVLRIWNYFDAITEGEDDGERYRRFCVGRARGMGEGFASFPAATAIGRRDGRRVLQIYLLAAREPGTPLENPRQVAAWRYPRQYGPQSPSFARATLAGTPGLPLMISGTASVVGHETLHAERIEAQLAETFANLDALVAHAREVSPRLPSALGADSLLKVYLRHRAHLPQVRAALAARLPAGAPSLVLHAEVCRRDLLVEIDGFHG